MQADQTPLRSRPIKDAAAPAVLDPCCGSGTLLLERERLGRCGLLTGVDLSAAALDAARENAGSVRVQLIRKDFCNFVPKARYDEVYANLPFGIRVGSHDDNERLYRALIQKLKTLLTPDGVAGLYSTEHRLLCQLLSREPGLRLCRVVRCDAGGLSPWLFILRPGQDA